jgi:pyridoxamine 5'-phosphate oxidase
MHASPHPLFTDWFTEARAVEPNDPEAMCLATVDARGQPSARMVLLKGHDERGFVFYTNAHSRKGKDLQAGRPVALLFHWKSLRRQVRIEGAVSVVAADEADAYFASRSRSSQLGAWASDQSALLPERAVLEERYAAAERRFNGQVVPRPPHWGGWRVRPERIEFWRDGAHRLHERTVYERTDEQWRTHDLFP